MYFTIALNKIDSQYPQKGAPLMLELTLRNTVKRVARIHNFDFELWHDAGGAPYTIIGQLRPDFQNARDTAYKFIAEYQPEQQATMRFLWHYTPEQLQKIEDARRGGALNLRLYGHCLTVSTYPNQTSTVADWENCMSINNSGYPYCFTIPQSDWVSLLEKIGFRHVLLREIDWPPFPPAWTRSQEELREAWNHHRAGRYEEAMLSCRRALECIAINITGDPKAKRNAVIEQLFPNFPTSKQQALANLWGSIQDTLNVAVHNNVQQVTWSKQDSELLLLCTTATLGRLSHV
jgi:hypothetical protein